MTPGVSIVIPNWNGLELLKRFLPSVIAATTHYGQQFNCSTEIVIIDDGSVDASVEWLLGEGFEEAEGDGATRRRGEKILGLPRWKLRPAVNQSLPLALGELWKP